MTPRANIHVARDLTSKQRIALAVPQGLPFLERLLHGVVSFARKQEAWTFTRMPEGLSDAVTWLRSWPGNGAIASVVTPAEARMVQSLPFPVVNVASHLPDPKIPSVVVDHRAIGELAARHFIERQFVRFGYFGAQGKWYSQLRREGFQRTVRSVGGDFQAYEVPAPGRVPQWRDEQPQLADWLLSLQPPVGILACTDVQAGMVLDACREIGLRVPDDVAVIGVDNNPVFAEFDDPPLTTVSRNDHAVGLRAAELLSQLMAGAKPPVAPIFVPPDCVVQRQSTETIAVEDPAVVQAVCFIKEHLHQRFGVEALLGHVQLSRRALEHRFRSALGSSPYEYINRLRVESAKRLLSSPSSPKLASVSAQCGFTDPRRFRAVFQRLVGMSPNLFQRQERARLSEREGAANRD